MLQCVTDFQKLTFKVTSFIYIQLLISHKQQQDKSHFKDDLVSRSSYLTRRKN